MRSLPALPLLALLAGCGEPQPFRAETELRPDGTVARSVQQIDLAGTDAEWAGARRTRTTSADDWDEPVTSVPADPDGDATVAWGTFLSAAAMPAHVRDGDERPTVLARDPVLTDYGILTQYEWRETVEPGFDLGKAETARDALVLAATDHLELVLADDLPDVNAAPLIRWVRTTGDAFTADALRLWFDHAKAAAGRPIDAGNNETETDSTASRTAFATLAGDYGLDVLDDDGEPLPFAEVEARKKEFVDDLLRSRLLTDSGEPVDAATVDRVKRLFTFPPTGDAEDGEEISAVHERAILARYGSMEAFKSQIGERFGDLLGGLFANLFERREFVYRQKMPGLLLGTNGTVLADGSSGPADVLFRFPLTDAFPAGRDMTARSVLIDADRQREMLGDVRVATPVQITEFLELVSDPNVARVWGRCRDAGSLDPLRNVLRAGRLGRFARLLGGGRDAARTPDAPPAGG